MTKLTLLLMCVTLSVISIHAQQPNIRLGGSTQNFPNSGFQNGASNNNGFNSVPNQGPIAGTNFQRTMVQGAVNNFGGGRGFSSPFRVLGPGRMPLGFGNSFSRPGFAPSGRPVTPLSPMATLMMSMTRNPNNYRYATCIFNDTSSTVKGRADFRQFLIGEGREQVNIRVQLSGLPQAMSDVERGMHVHEFGDVGDTCARVGPHFNPNQTPHGSQRNFAFLRHVGDLGNIIQSMDGLVSTQFTDSVISLEGMNNIVGRALVIKLERDDLGRGNNRESQVNGNTHNPIACCTIGRTTSRNWYDPMTAQEIQEMATTGMMPDATRSNLNSMNPPIVRPGINNPNTVTSFNPVFRANVGAINQNNPNGNIGINTFNGQPGMTSFNAQPGMNNGNPNIGLNNFLPNTGMRNINQPVRRPASVGSGTFLPGAQGQMFNFNSLGKRK